MFSDLKTVVDLIRTGVSDYRGFKSKKSRENAVLELLRTYFLLLDCVEEAERLFVAAGPNPVEKIRGMESSEAKVVIDIWDLALRKQAIRLRTLQGFILGQDHLAVINPTLQNRISAVVGDKFETNLNLYKIGAHLFFSSMFQLSNNEERAEAVLVMAGAEGDNLDMAKIESDIAALRESLDQYRLVVTRLVSDSELLELSGQARKETSLDQLREEASQ